MKMIKPKFQPGEKVFCLGTNHAIITTIEYVLYDKNLNLFKYYLNGWHDYFEEKDLDAFNGEIFLSQ